MRSILVATMLVSLCVAPSSAIAGYAAHRDADDTENQIDFRVVRLAHRYEPNRAIVVIRRYERRHPDYLRLQAYFDARGPARADHRVDAIFDSGSSGWVICAVRARGHGQIGDCSSLREHARTIRIAFRWRLLNVNKPLRWRLTGEDWSTDDRPIVDRAPDFGFYTD